MVTPLALIRRLRRSDPLERAWPPPAGPSLWHTPERRERTHYEHPS
jgi:hypothetical protein